jgi:CheY-like chemotaxis protein
MDILLPGQDGWEAIARLKSDPLTGHIPVMIISVVDNRVLASRLGVDAYLVKPIRRDDLPAALERLTGTGGRAALTVDDDPDARNLLVQLLEGTPFSVRVAASGQEALTLMEQTRPDVILIDLLMPEMDGFAVIERLQSDPARRDIPVVIVTARELTAEERRFLEERTQGIAQKATLDRDTFLRLLKGR